MLLTRLCNVIVKTHCKTLNSSSPLGKTMIVGRKNFAGVSTPAARAYAEIINKHICDLDPLYVMHGVITEFTDGRCTVHVRTHDNSEHINAEVNPAGELSYLESRIFDDDGYSAKVENMGETKSGLWTTLRMLQANNA